MLIFARINIRVTCTMKYIITLMGLFTFGMTHAQIQRVEPPFWWEGMHYSQVQVLLYGKNIAQYNVESDLPIVNILKTENPNYLFVTVDTKDKKAGNYTISLLQKKKKVFFNFLFTLIFIKIFIFIVSFTTQNSNCIIKNIIY